MSDKTKPPVVSDALAVIGGLTGGVAGELVRPLRELRERLAVMVETLDHHIGHARGPTPFPWKQTGWMREQLADTYLLSRQITRLMSDLADATSKASQAPGPADVNRLVEQALNLARHRFTSEIEVLADLGAIGPARLAPGPFVLAIAQLLVAAVEAARGSGQSAIALQTRAVGAGTEDHAITVAVSVGAGFDALAMQRVVPVVRALAEAYGGTFDSADEGEGHRFELGVAPVR